MFSAILIPRLSNCLMFNYSIFLDNAVFKYNVMEVESTNETVSASIPNEYYEDNKMKV